MKQLLLMLGIVAAATTAGPVMACACVSSGTISERLSAYDVVFVADVVATELIGQDGLPPKYRVFTEHGKARGAWMVSRVTVMRVREVWKGEVPPFTVVLTGMSGDSCGVEFRNGRLYLVFGQVQQSESNQSLVGSDRAIHVDLCSGSGPLANSREISSLRPASVTPELPNWFKVEP